MMALCLSLALLGQRIDPMIENMLRESDRRRTEEHLQEREAAVQRQIAADNRDADERRSYILAAAIVAGLVLLGLIVAKGNSSASTKAKQMSSKPDTRPPQNIVLSADSATVGSRDSGSKNNIPGGIPPATSSSAKGWIAIAVGIAFFAGSFYVCANETSGVDGIIDGMIGGFLNPVFWIGSILGIYWLNRPSRPNVPGAPLGSTPITRTALTIDTKAGMASPSHESVQADVASARPAETRGKGTREESSRGSVAATAAISVVFIFLAGLIGYAMRPTMEKEATRYMQRAEAAERELAELKAISAEISPDGSRAIDNGTDFGTVRAAAQWVLQVGGTVEVLDADKLVYSLSSGKPLPERPFQIVGLNLDVPKSSSSTALANFAGIRAHLGAFRDVLWIRVPINWYIRNAAFLSELPRLESVSIFGSSQATDIEALSALPKLTRLTLSQFPSDGYGHLPKLTALRFLSIQEGTIVADELTQVLRTTGGLKALELPDSGASRLVAARLKDLRPELSVRLLPTNRDGHDDGT